MYKLQFYLGFISILCFQTMAGRQIQFTQEDIELAIEGNTCTIKGLYWFTNQSSHTLRTSLFYPFVVQDSLPYPDSICVINEISGQQVEFTKNKTGVIFLIELSPLQTAFYRVTYRQKTVNQYIQYLLLTTLQWRTPLEQARYRVRLPKQYILTFSTIHFYDVKVWNEEQIFESCFEHYMPSTDFLVRWERRIP
jgi:hypothetical protein